MHQPYERQTLNTETTLSATEEHHQTRKPTVANARKLRECLSVCPSVYLCISATKLSLHVSNINDVTCLTTETIVRQGNSGEMGHKRATLLLTTQVAVQWHTAFGNTTTVWYRIVRVHWRRITNLIIPILKQQIFLSLQAIQFFSTHTDSSDTVNI